MGSTAAGRRRHLLIPTAVVAASVLGACSGGDDATATTTVAVTAAPTTPPPTTAPPTTTAAPTTPAPTTTAPPTTAPPTTPTTQSVPLQELEVVLPQAVGAFVDAVNAAFRDPASAELRSRIAESATTAMVEQLTQALDQYVVDGRFFRESASSPSSIQPFVDTIGTAAGGSSAAMDVCVIDTDVLVERTPDGTETVVEESVDANVILYSFELVDGRWLVSGLDVADTPGSGDCR